MSLAPAVRFIWVTVVVLCSLNKMIEGNDSTTCGSYEVYDRNKYRCVDFEWCLYKFYSKRESWFNAKAVCEHDNLTLAKITDDAQREHVSSLMISSLSLFDANPSSSVWIGAYRVNTEVRWQDDCVTIDPTYASKDDKDACFLFDGGSTFVSDSCNMEHPFLCQASTLDSETCFTGVASIGGSSVPGRILVGTNMYDCLPLCSPVSCVGFRYKSPYCTICTFKSLAYTKGGALNQLYTKDLLRTVPIDITARTSQLQDLCPAVVTTQTQQTHSAESSSTEYTYTTTVNQQEHPTEASSPDSTRTATVPSVSDLEPSSTDPTPGVVETSSGSTPPLTNVITSVNLALTSLPTAAEKTDTISATCSTCSCIKPTPVDKEELEDSISQLKEQLRINPKELSSYKRALTSAPDDRQSAANIGYVGILVICLVPGIIVLIDMGRLIREFKQFISRLKNSQRTTATITPIERT